MKHAATAMLALVAVALTACRPAPTAEPTTEPTLESIAETITMTLFVGPETVPCTGVAPMDCLQVKESLDGQWQLFYDSIEGFAYEPGSTYELVVQVTTLPSAPADASTRRYRLVEVVGKTAVAPGEASGHLALEGPTWLLATHGDPRAPIPVLEGTQITATFLEGRVSGTGGCNGYFAGYELDGDRLTVESPGSTMMACDEPIMAQEQAYLAALSRAASYEIVAGRLVVTTGDEMTLTYDPQPAGLEGTAWTVTGYNNGREAVVSPILDTEITASFGEGKVSGTTGCNRYDATAAIDGTTITVAPPAATSGMCSEPEGIMDQEMQFLAALQSAVTWRRDGDRLELRTSEDALALTLVSADGE